MTGFQPPSTIVRGALWMAASALAFVAMMASVRALSATYGVFEIAFCRTVVALALIAPVAFRNGIGGIRTERLGGHVVRVLCTFVALMANFYALAHAPLADVTAIMFLTPLLATLGAALLLREDVGTTRWFAVVVGLAGALIIIRPGFAEVGLATAAMVLCSLGFAGEWIAVKALTRTESADAITFYVTLFLLPLTFVPAVFSWTDPAWADAPLLLAVGFFAWAALMCQARSFAAADASAVIPFDFLRLPFAAVLGLALFGEVSDLWTWVGAAIIFASGWFVVRGEMGDLTKRNN